MGFGVWGLGFGVWGLGFWGLGFKVLGLGGRCLRVRAWVEKAFRIQGPQLVYNCIRDKALLCRQAGLGLRVQYP